MKRLLGIDEGESAGFVARKKKKGIIWSVRSICFENMEMLVTAGPFYLKNSVHNIRSFSMIKS